MFPNTSGDTEQKKACDQSQVVVTWVEPEGVSFEHYRGRNGIAIPISKILYYLEATVSMVLLSKSRLRVLVDSFFFFLLLAIRTLALHDEEPVRSSDKSQLDRIWLVL
ncbi:hypothetical protein PGT21_028896 [Puccinia graminis f. sp. tritici]|uniref:Uncharacterized protein n=1 Tax=Puccinia graminis f. sp. tritici TaxID=56615 RepID=A0A5B0P1I0_PUCGR|nr:hypothetical protein PGT21_028896 [Puccinia graminis f. sp. tritici]